ncbi:MAG TPA: hypothetical protein VNU19_01965 [Candidatus Acidoferrum sp.]|jgi:hypothetical protein|nr:hypothetical protein [Candidatus Acidoferrum sp.]
MDAFGIVFSWCVTAFFGLWTGLGVAQTMTGQFMFRMFNPARIDWSMNEIRLSGVSWTICGFVGLLSVLVFDLFGPLGVGTPWIMYSNPWVPVFLCTLLVQVLIEQHHRRRWPFNRRSST